MAEELLVPEGGQAANPQPFSKPTGDVKPWSTSKEFQGGGKTITPTNFQYLTGEQTTARMEWRDENGGTYRLTFIDHDNGDKERFYENKYKSFFNNVSEAKIKKGKRYHVEVDRSSGKYVWVFKLLEESAEDHI